jgi:hypothetical protein
LHEFQLCTNFCEQTPSVRVYLARKRQVIALSLPTGSLKYLCGDVLNRSAVCRDTDSARWGRLIQEPCLLQAPLDMRG